MSGNKVTLHRVIKATPERLYRAFIEPEAMVKWFPPHGFTGKVHSIDAKEGGSYRMSFTNFSTGKSHSFTGTYLELKPNELIRYHDQFDDPGLPGQMMITIGFKPVLNGTELTIEQDGIPEMIPVEFCYAGWQESLQLLAFLTEPDIAD